MRVRVTSTIAAVFLAFGWAGAVVRLPAAAPSPPQPAGNYGPADAAGFIGRITQKMADGLAVRADAVNDSN